ncbi:MAG TPA: LysM peptidoglycan-binding domain-containing protein [Candidatus Excrementavichristensenella intestinipullorum]|nr:LysM peptidoglycan-binding domain-containing protein [Candidatus Excrementavichristensenella intestinipullorum]
MTAVVREDETLNMLSARLGVPGCMLLRCNGLYSPAWLLPGREILVPEDVFCHTSDFPCPAGALHRPAGRATGDEEHPALPTDAPGHPGLA